MDFLVLGEPDYKLGRYLAKCSQAEGISLVFTPSTEEYMNAAAGKRIEDLHVLLLDPDKFMTVRLEDQLPKLYGVTESAAELDLPGVRDVFEIRNYFDDEMRVRRALKAWLLD